ncbi:MAG: ATP-binding protein [Bacteroidota bacterium]
MLLVFLASVWQQVALQAQRLNFDLIGLKQGLPSEGAFDIVQDRNGYIWIATLNGLVKYDGYEFNIYRGIQEDSISAKPVGRSFVSLLKSQDGSFWASTLSKGFSHYLPDQERFENFYNEIDSLGDAAFPRHELLFEDSQGRIWMYGINPARRLVKFRQFDPQTRRTLTFEVGPRSGQRLLLDGYIVEDQNGDVWIHDAANKNIYTFNPESKKLAPRINCENLYTASGACAQINHLMVDEANLLWISTDKGLFIYNIDQQQFEQQHPVFQNFPSLQEGAVFYAYTDAQGHIWMLQEGKSLVSYHRQSDQFKEFPLQKQPFQGIGTQSSQYLFKPIMGNEEGIWFVSDLKRFSVFNRQFFYYKYSDGTFTSYGENFRQSQNKANAIPSGFIKDAAGLVWISDISSGIHKQNPISQRIDSWVYAQDPYGLATDSIYSVKEDREGQIWIMGKGMVQYFDESCQCFKAILPNGFPQIRFNTFQEDSSGTRWFGSDQGLFYLNEDKQSLEISLRNPDPTGIGIEPMLIDQQGHLWIKYLHKALGKEYGKSLGIVDPVKKRLRQRFNHNPEDSTSLVSELVRDLHMDKKGRIWIASFAGLCRYNRTENNFIQYKVDPSSPHSISSNFISFILEDSKENIWFGTFEKGLNRYEEALDGFRNWYDTDKFSVTLTGLEDQNHQLWFGTERGEGLFQMNESYQLDTFINRNAGLASDVVSQLIEDDLGYFWIPSELGIARFHPSDGTIKIFTREDGFDLYGSEAMSQHAKIIKSRQGDLWLSTYKKLYRINPRRLLHSSGKAPVLHINSLKVNDQTYRTADGQFLTEHISQTRSFALDHDQNDLTFGFIALHYALSSENQYSYKLEGFDKDWSEPSFERKARYAGIPSGNYTFRVLAAGADGIWTEQSTDIQFKIRKPWWETPLAYVCYCLVLAALVYLIIKRITKKQEEKIKRQEKELEMERQMTEQLKALDQLKDQFLANTSHELRTPLNGIIGLSEGVYDRSDDTDNKEDLELIINSGKRLHYLVDDLLDFSKLKKGDFELNKTSVDLRSVIDLIFRMSKPAVEKKNLQLKNEISEDIPAVQADMHRIQQVLYNLIGNAIKFTKEGEVRVCADEMEGKIKISISDTGIGIPADKTESIFEEFQQADGSTARQFGGTGLGLTITKRLVELHGGTIGVESKPGAGSTFWFTLNASDQAGEKVSAQEGTLVGLNPTMVNNEGLQEEDLSTDHELYQSQALSQPKTIARQEGKFRILIVDDEPVNQRVIKSHLSDDNFDLTFADDGISALKIIDNSAMFDLVLLDVMMPNMSGYEVCNKIREKYLPSELPVIMVTAKNQVSDLISGLNRGANDYLAKPFTKQEFKARVKTQLDLRNIFNVTDRYIPNEFINTLGHDRITDVNLGDLVEKEVSVLFTDIRSYTTLSESMTPRDTFKFISGYTKRMGPVIKENNGFVNQYLGDGIMAIFQDSPEDALNGMIGMQLRLREYNLERIEKSRPEISVGMGLHTGSLIMGIIGDSRRRDAATISDTVNTAARMEGLTKKFGVKILITGQSHQNLSHPDKYHFRYLGKVSVKGKMQRLDAYECMDGDPPEEMAGKLETMEAFDEMVYLYQHKKFLDALKVTEDILKINPSDKVVQYYHSLTLEKNQLRLS